MVKTENISSKVRNEKKVSILPTLIQYSFGIPSQSKKIGGRIRMDSNRGGRSQIILTCR
jgi:hypothetical protein